MGNFFPLACSIWGHHNKSYALKCASICSIYEGLGMAPKGHRLLTTYALDVACCLLVSLTLHALMCTSSHSIKDILVYSNYRGTMFSTKSYQKCIKVYLYYTGLMQLRADSKQKHNLFWSNRFLHACFCSSCS